MLPIRSAALLGVLLSVPGAAAPGGGPIRGFTAAAARVERDWETKFQAVPAPDSLREYMRFLSARPHHLGSPRDSVTVAWMVQRLSAWGLDARIETFHVLFPTPRERLVELVGPSRFTARLRESALREDPASGQQSEQLPTYNAYSPDGDVTAPLVFVNYGIPEDYDRLARLGVSVKGAIVIAKYGRSWRGIKPKLAAEHGAVGCLIYSDPEDDGYHAGEVYPAGAFRPKDGVQRGSVMDMPLFAGDPLTPGIGATVDAKRLDRAEAPTLAKIPVQPISAADAQPLLAALGGRVAPANWAGALPITYHVGPGPARVRLKLRFDWRLVPAHDIIVRIPGAEWPDEWVVRGNHHDAWVNGAEDPVSGAVALLEEARAYGRLLEQGWRPRRTIVLALWDGEEPMLLGSTEWAETHAAELRRGAVAYLNTDGNGRGRLDIDGSPSLARLISEVARDVPDPETAMSVWRRSHLGEVAVARTAERRREARDRTDLLVAPMGSGSDYTAFYHHLGVPSLNIGFGGEDDGGIYHSIYDSFRWYTMFSDTSFVYGRALAQTVGLATMRLASAQVLPYEFSRQSDRVGSNLKDVQELLTTMRDSIEEQNRQVDESTFVAMNDPRRPTVVPVREDVPPFVNFAPLQNGATRLKSATSRFEGAYAAATKDTATALDAGQATQLNELLFRAERALAPDEGLPQRPWYRQLISAPGWYTGYSPKTLPGVREAIEAKRWEEAEGQAARLGEALERQATLLDEASTLLESRGGRTP
ncbi:MAG TPA: transferrin receptor-like dimerization domain-containing protein [Gemmatimonadales bacterium]|nr:transferrin receptor-like dimerization domain-containing protein [Gemmatimonadales bacterium]